MHIQEAEEAEADYVRTLETQDKVAKVHWWYYPDSYQVYTSCVYVLCVLIYVYMTLCIDMYTILTITRHILHAYMYVVY
jgi:hypothetical protein